MHIPGLRKNRRRNQTIDGGPRSRLGAGSFLHGTSSVALTRCPDASNFSGHVTVTSSDSAAVTRILFRSKVNSGLKQQAS